MTAARVRHEVVEECVQLPPTVVATVDLLFKGALVQLREGPELLTHPPLKLDDAAAQVMDATPALDGGYDGFAEASQAVLRLGPA